MIEFKDLTATFDLYLFSVMETGFQQNVFCTLKGCSDAALQV